MGLIFLATLGEGHWNTYLRDYLAGYAASDAVGRHTLTTDPEIADLIVFIDAVQHPDDPTLKHLGKHELVMSHPEKIVVYDWRDRPVFNYPGVYVSGSARQARFRSMRGGPYPAGLRLAPVPSGMMPHLLYSFSGSRTHPVRDRIFALDDPRAAISDTSGRPAAELGKGDEAGAAQYIAALARSKFVLCPRGHGPSSYRIFETLSAGRVPVIISDRWLPPSSIDWSACSLRVSESDVGAIPRLVREAEPRWHQLAAAATMVWAHSFDQAHLWDYVVGELFAAVDQRRYPLPIFTQLSRVRLIAISALRSWHHASARANGGRL